MFICSLNRAQPQQQKFITVAIKTNQNQVGNQTAAVQRVQFVAAQQKKINQITGSISPSIPTAQPKVISSAASPGIKSLGTLPNGTNNAGTQKLGANFTDLISEVIIGACLDRL